jgi:hypothetical protein
VECRVFSGDVRAVLQSNVFESAESIVFDTATDLQGNPRGLEGVSAVIIKPNNY